MKCIFSGVILQSAGGDQPADKAESDIKAFFSENVPCLQFFSPTTSNQTGQQLVSLDIVYSSQLPHKDINYCKLSPILDNVVQTTIN